MPDAHKPTWLLAGLLVFTLLVRGSAMWAMRDNLKQDADAYREIAENLLRHGEFALGKGEPEGEPLEESIRPTAYRPPLYPVVLSNLPVRGGQDVSLAKAAVLHLGLGVATVWLTWAAARRFLSRVYEAANGGEMHHRPDANEKVHFAALMHPTFGPLVAGFIVACDPILLNQQSLVMTETLAAFLAILSLWGLARFDLSRSWFDAGLAGGAMGLAVLCRPTILPWLLLVAAGMLVVGGRRSDVRGQTSWVEALCWRAANVLALMVVAGAVVSPWAIRNYRVFGKPIVTTTHGGYTLVLGNNEYFYAWLDMGEHATPWRSLALEQDLNNEAFLILIGNEHPEISADRFYYDRAAKVIRENPRLFVSACLYRVWQLWSPLPHQLTADESLGRRSLRYATCAWYLGVYTLVAVGMGRLRWRLLAPPWVWGVLLCVAFMAVHTFYWTNLRMRAPLMPFVAIVAGAAFARRDDLVARRQMDT